MKLPNGQQADLGTKLEDYVLNPLHREGKRKARVFESVLGISITNVAALRRALRDHAARSDDAEWRGDNGFGNVYVLRCPVTTAKGTASVLTVWIVRHGENFRRLTTCYIE